MITLKQMKKVNLKSVLFIFFICFSVIMVQKTRIDNYSKNFVNSDAAIKQANQYTDALKKIFRHTTFNRISMH